MRRGTFSAFVVAIASAMPAFAATKTMECQRYQLGPDNLTSKTALSIYEITANLEAGTLAINLTAKPKDNSAGEFPLPARSDWKIIWRSQDLLRVVALVTDYSSNPFDSPVMMIDVDFANVTMAYATAGGLTDFSSVASDPWKYECKRLD